MDSLLSTPAFSYDVILNLTKIELEFIPDPNIYILLEKGRYSKANNKYLKSYDPKQESNHVIYLDINNLCGYTMSAFIPTNWPKWKDPKVFGLNKHTSNSSNKKDMFLKLILNIQKKYENYTMIIL